MDILDIDEALKDDSFICLEDKTHDDVSNILQQWKSNNCMLPPYQQEQAYKLNSRTFTRPRRKSAQNLEAQFPNASNTNGLQAQVRNTQPMLNLEIGGLVTTMHKSFLQDTSPPSSICSSMDVSMERMNNSLITSADFTNINFLQSTQSLDFNDIQNMGNDGVFNLADKATSDGYTLNDMIRDRKVLESLTMSGDGTLIKDSHIAQIDDISLAFSKTASAYSTMDNSTESVEEQNRTVSLESKERKDGTINALSEVAVAGDHVGIMHKTMLLSDDVISDTTFDLVESSLCSDSMTAEGTPCEEPALNLTHDSVGNVNAQAEVANGTFKKPRAMDETICLTTRQNSTFDCQMTPETRADLRCETPENVGNLTGLKFYESTPHATNVQQPQQQQQYTPSLKLVDDVNISPIVASKEQLNATRVLSDTFAHEPVCSKSKSIVNSKTFSGTLPHLESIEFIENIENPNETYEKSSSTGGKRNLEQSAANIEMQNVLDLAQAEEELLASNNDQEFEDMLEEFSKVELNAEHTKMKKSLETIKRRFNYSARHEAENGKLNATVDGKNQELQKSKESLNDSVSEHRRSFLKDSNSSNSTVNAELKRSMQNSLKDSHNGSAHGSTMSTSSVMSSGSGERLLSRRSRLYDNINLSQLSAHSPVRSPLDASYTVQKSDTGVVETVQKGETELSRNTTELQQLQAEEKTENESAIETDETKNVRTLYKLAEKRERDRDRFKTKIVKERNPTEDMKVPCIDDELNGGNFANNVDVEAGSSSSERLSQHEDEVAVFNNNKSEVEAKINAEAPTKATSKINPNFLTYKKPRDKQLPAYNLPDVTSESVNDEECRYEVVAAETAIRARSRSRPRYISGLQKLSVVKATSAGDLEKTSSTAAASGILQPLSKQQNDSVVNGNRLSRIQPLKTGGGNSGVSELKSPMGTKSKSFHNLSSNFGYSGATATSGLPAPRTLGFGLKKPNNSSSGNNTTLSMQKETKVTNARGTAGVQAANVQQQQQSTGEAVFKVPRLVSGIRAPAVGGIKRAGLVRPSSGYYSLNVGAKSVVQTNDADSDAGRHSPTDSMSSASSRSSIQSGGSGIKPPAATTTAPVAKPVLPATLTKITTGATGIPKPSGLRPPTTVKRSGLPKPAASGIARR